MIPASAELWVIRRYGGKKPWLRCLWAQIKDALGLYRRYRAINMGAVRRLVFVCKGNICRSAYAQARARHLGLHATSAGFEADDRRPADPAAARHAAARGLSLAHHRTTPLARLDIATGDLLIAMEPDQASALAANDRASGVQVTVLGLWVSPSRPYLQDPYGLADPYWDTCLTLIDRAVERLGQAVAVARGQG